MSSAGAGGDAIRAWQRLRNLLRRRLDPGLRRDLRLLRSRRIAFVTSGFGSPRHTCEPGREQLALLGVGSELLQVESLVVERDLASFDVLILNRVPADPPLEDFLRRARGRGVALVGDLDDLLLDEDVILAVPHFRDGPAAARERLRSLAAGLRRCYALCPRVLCYTGPLERELSRFGCRPLRIETCALEEMVDRGRLAVASVRRDERFVTIGYAAGHPGHATSLRMVSGVLARLLDAEPTARFVAFGGLEPPPELARHGERVERLPYLDWRELPREVRRLDIAIAPLDDVAFNAGKSHTKYLDAGLSAVPLLASPVGHLGQTVRDGVTGLLAAGEEDWFQRLLLLVRSPQLRRALGERAHADVIRRYTTRARAPLYARTLARAVRASAVA